MERERGGRPRYPGVLTPAEQRVLEALRDGGSNAEIAARLGLSRETVKTHIASMLSKLDLADRRELAAWRPEPPRRGARGWLGLLVRPAIGLGAATGILAVIVIFAVVIGASREVVSCSSGIAVTNPDANTELVGDCESLLGLRDTLRGTAALNWTAGKPMAEWMGVTVSGTPQRVTALNLSGFGLNGELSGLLGNLTGLTELQLDGNALTGMLPSKLIRLTSLTTVSLSGTSFTGCAPPVLRTAATNDVTATGLDDCGAPPDIESIEPDDVIPSGTYYYDLVGTTTAPSLVFDVPERASLEYLGLMVVNRIGPSRDPKPGGNEAVAFKNHNSATLFGLDVTFGGEFGRNIDPAVGDNERQALSELFDLMAESTWLSQE